MAVIPAISAPRREVEEGLEFIASCVDLIIRDNHFNAAQRPQRQDLPLLPESAAVGMATAWRRFRFIRNKHQTAWKPAWILANKLIRIRREPKNSLFP
jgi:hypothetical protein